ncbi:MAG TPA: 3-dehydroquinate dehydratase [Flavobacteriales bacterium]|nr:3-dehydroquinate dehydratase [Flavobacteriales bacterium]
MKCKIINGPNLNLLGKRETDIYGEESFDTYLEKLKAKFPALTIDYYQSNIEGEIIDELQRIDEKYDAVILNAGGYTHTSVAIADAVASMKTGVIEVHISNIMNREHYRSNSLIAPKCLGTITGFGLNGYELAVYAIVKEGS